MTNFFEQLKLKRIKIWIQKKNKKNNQDSNATLKLSEVRSSSASINSEVGTKISLSNRLSAKFSTSKPKKSSGHQAFQFLKPKHYVNNNIEDTLNSRELNFEEEDFFDADHVINSIDIPQTNHSNNLKYKLLIILSIFWFIYWF